MERTIWKMPSVWRVLAAFLCALALMFAPGAAWADDIASGTCGTCDWVIDGDGVLTISPTDGVSGTLDSFADSDDVPWYDYNDDITSACIEDGVSAGESTSWMFASCNELTEIDGLGNLDVSNVKDMDLMFFACESVTSLDVSNWDVSNVETMDQMFSDCEELSELDVSSWDVSSALNISSLFRNCYKLESQDLSGWDVSNVTDMGGVFNGCRSWTDISSLEDWDTSNVTDMSYLFRQCVSVTDYSPIYGWDVSNVTDMMCMFAGCSAKSLDLSSWSVSNVESISEMFEDASIENLDLSGWDTSNVIYASRLFHRASLGILDLSGWDTSSMQAANPFYNSTGLVKITVGSDFSFDELGPLPAPVDDDGAEGRWMNAGTGEVYDDPDDIPNNTAATYIAVFDEFSDVPYSASSKYYFEGVYGMAGLGYITGYSNGKFGVGDTMTREQFVTILWRMAGEPDASGNAGFSDVKSSGYYAEAVNWAYENDIMAGYSNGKFGVGEAITFEQMCTVIARYACGGDDALNKAVTDAQAAKDLESFTDVSKVSSWADNGMAWCVGQGLVSGNSDGTLAPKSNVARERAATVLWRATCEGTL